MRILTSPYTRWRVDRARRRVRRILCRNLYRDTKGDVRRSIIIAGAGRSGTTWLADIIGSHGSCRLMFEPFLPERVEEYSGFEYFQYMRPHDTDDKLRSFSERVLTGRIRNPWIDRHVEVLIPEYRLVKEIRICLLLRWLHEQFSEVPILLLVRHPCAVVASRIQLGWATDSDIEPFLRQPKLIDDHLRAFLPVIQEAATEEEKHAIVWCVSNLVPLRQFADVGLEVVFYEQLCRQPAREIPRIYRRLGWHAEEWNLRAAARPSTTTRDFSAPLTGDDPLTRWRSLLSEDQIARIMAVVQAFGLGSLYPSEEPNLDAIESFRGVLEPETRPF